MEWVKSTKFKPVTDVKVFVLTKTEKKGVATYSRLSNSWELLSNNLCRNDKITRWKYSEPIVNN